jgi:hypothetical protein
MIKTNMDKNKINFQFYILPICLILVLSFSRIIPHPWNFTPILATGIFSGFYFKNFILSLFVVVFSMFIGDLFIGFHNTMFFTYISLIAAVLLGCLIKNFNIKSIIFSGLLSSVVFFVVTNFGVWFLGDLYEKSFSGLMQSYVMAIPFFHNTLVSTLVYLIAFKLLFDFAIRKKILVNLI